MKKLFIVTALILITGQIFAQVPARARQQAATPLPPPLATREVSGIVKDETGQTVIGASIMLTSKKDTIRTATNEDGIFILKDVKLATFAVEVKGIGYTTFIKRYLNSDITKRIVLPQILLKTSATQLNEITINGAPSITYKTDTVEYKASDYTVRPNATVDEVLKKMEGVEVGTDGSVTFQGQAVGKAKLNGKEFSGGSVAQAIQNLPADIMDKIQFVDDYGDQAARTGVKDGDPQKVLNLTTKADRSVGTIARLTAQYGSHDRYNGNISIQRINANQTISLIGNFRNSILGVPSTGTGTGTGGGGGGGGGGGAGAQGTTTTGAPTLSYRDQWSKNIQVVGSAGYTYNDNNTTSSSYGQTYSGPTDFTRQNTNKTNTTGQNARLQMEINLDSANFLQLNPTFNRSTSNVATTSSNDNISHFTNGTFEHVLNTGFSSSTSNSSNYGLTALYLHVFKKPRRNVSIQASISRSDAKGNSDATNDQIYYNDETRNKTLKDSLSRSLRNTSTITNTYAGTLTYVEPLNKLSQLEFRADITQTDRDSKILTDTVTRNGVVVATPEFNNIYNYSTTNMRGALDYRYNGTKLNLSIGAAVAPYALTGTKIDNNTGAAVSTSRTFFRVVPAFRSTYSWSRTERLTVNYTGRNNEPDFTTIQPFVDRSNPNRIVVGNPDLKPSFTHTVTGQYSNYLANSKFNMFFMVTTNRTDNSISSNTIRIQTPIDPLKPGGPKKSISEVHYVNLDGQQSIYGNYSFSKQLNDRKYSLNLLGSVSYGYSPAMNDNVLYHVTQWSLNERFSPRISPSDNVDVNPFAGYTLARGFTTSPNGVATLTKTLSLGITGNTYFFQTWRIRYSGSKRFITGTGANVNPLVLDGGFEKEIGTKRSLVITFDIYDILHQNTYNEQVQTATGVTNTVSNDLSRYFMFGIRLNLQKWSGRPQQNGRNMQRRGDGSFIYN